MTGAARGTPLVSVITPAWNASATLARTIASVQAQSLADWEMLIVDDGSADGTRRLAERHAAGDGRIRVAGLAANAGAAAARNLGIGAARGRFIAFLDADDRWRPEKLARQLAAMEAAACPFAFSAYARFDAAGRPLGTVAAPARIDHAGLLKGNVIGCLTAIYDTHALGKVEMPAVRRRQDYGLWLRLLKRTPYALGLPEVLADYSVGRTSLSANKLVAARATWTVLREVEGLPPASAAYYFLHYAAKHLRRR